MILQHVNLMLLRCFRGTAKIDFSMYCAAIYYGGGSRWWMLTTKKSTYLVQKKKRNLFWAIYAAILKTMHT